MKARTPHSYSSLSLNESQEDDSEISDDEKIAKEDDNDAEKPKTFHSKGDQILETFLVAFCILGHALLMATFLVLGVYTRSNAGPLLTFNNASLGKFGGYLYRRVVASPDIIIKVRLLILLFYTLTRSFSLLWICTGLSRPVAIHHTETRSTSKHQASGQSHSYG